MPITKRNPIYHRRRDERMRLDDARRGQWVQREAFLTQVRDVQLAAIKSAFEAQQADSTPAAESKRAACH